MADGRRRPDDLRKTSIEMRTGVCTGQNSGWFLAWPHLSCAIMHVGEGRVHYLITSDCPIIRAAEAERSQRELFLWKTNSGPGVTCVSAGSGIKQLSEPFWILLAPSTTLYLATKMPNPTFYIRDTSLEVLFSCRTLRIIVR